jgi:hypothetical protein
LRPAASASAASVASEAATRSQWVASATKSAGGVSATATGTGEEEAKPTVANFQGAAGGVREWSVGAAVVALFAGLL